MFLKDTVSTCIYYSCYGWVGAHVSQVITFSDLAGVGTALCISIYIERTLTGGGSATMSAKHASK